MPASASSRELGVLPGVIMHTDQGSEGIHRPGGGPGRLRAAFHRPADGRPGSAPDNEVIESLHSTLEFALRRAEHLATKTAARAKLAAGDRGLQHQWTAYGQPEDTASGLRTAAGSPGGGSLTMTPPLPAASIRQCPARSRSFLPGPDGPAGAPPGQRLRSGVSLGHGEDGETRSALTHSPHFRGHGLELYMASRERACRPGRQDRHRTDRGSPRGRRPPGNRWRS